MDEERKNKDIDIEEIVTDNLEENESKIEENTAELNDFDNIDEDYTDDILYKKTDLGESIQEDVVEEKEKVKQKVLMVLICWFMKQFLMLFLKLMFGTFYF